MISKYLRQRRERAALTQRKASELLGYKSSQFLSNVERGLSKPPIGFLNKLCDIYGVPKDEMLDEYLRYSREQAEEKARQEWAAAQSSAAPLDM